MLSTTTPRTFSDDTLCMPGLVGGMDVAIFLLEVKTISDVLARLSSNYVLWPILNDE